MNTRNEMKVKRDVSCTSTLHYSELRGAEPNPLDFRAAMGEIRGKTASLFFTLPHACYSSHVFGRLILMYVEILICFNMKRFEKLAHGYITGPNTKKMSNRKTARCLPPDGGCFNAGLQRITSMGACITKATNDWSCGGIFLTLIHVNTDKRR